MSEHHISYPQIRALAEDSVLVEFEAEVNLETNRKARCLVYGLEQAHLPGLKMAIPAYRSVIVYFDPFITTAKQIMVTAEKISTKLVMAGRDWSCATVVPESVMARAILRRTVSGSSSNAM